MRKFWAIIIGGLLALSPSAAFADTISVSQTVVITATVAPARSIVVNDAGQMIKIYSNTNERVAPKVYVGKAPGPEVVLTPQLKSQYDHIMAQPGSKNGVEIPVALPIASRGTVQQLFSLTASILFR